MTSKNLEILNNYVREWHETDVATAVKELLEEYKNEKEKNLIFKGSTIITDLEKDGIEININADKIVNEYLREKTKNSELEELLENSISKDIVQEMITERKFMLQQNYEEFENDIELKTLLKVLGTEQ